MGGWDGMHACHGALLEVSEELYRMGSCFPPWSEFRILNSAWEVCSASAFTHWDMSKGCLFCKVPLIGSLRWYPKFPKDKSLSRDLCQKTRRLTPTLTTIGWFTRSNFSFQEPHIPIEVFILSRQEITYYHQRTGLLFCFPSQTSFCPSSVDFLYARPNSSNIRVSKLMVLHLFWVVW